MRQKRLGCVIVTNGADQPSGIFTERELLTLLGVPDAMEKPIGDYQTKEFAAVTEDDPIEEVIKAMQAKDQRFVVVIDRCGKAQALTGQKGLMEFIADNFPWQVAVQRVGMGASTMREGA
jgi:CBS domain-containing protein